MQPIAPQPPKADPDWTTEVADRIESVVTAVREKTTVPAQQAALAVIYGLILLVVGIVIIVLLVIAIFRLHVYIPVSSESRKVWIADVVVGAIFVLLGGLLWRRRRPPIKE
jgi:threonine/homoserine/homoserine lactone efflux protein